jgi:hypothetical protein
MSTHHPFKKIISKLKAHYGQPKPPQSSDPFELILLENIAYLADDARREAAFEELRNSIGLRPVDILAAPLEKLISVTRLGGIHAEQRAQRLKESAQIVFNDFSGDLRTTLKLPFPQALKALQQFPSIGNDLQNQQAFVRIVSNRKSVRLLSINDWNELHSNCFLKLSNCNRNSSICVFRAATSSWILESRSDSRVIVRLGDGSSAAVSTGGSPASMWAKRVSFCPGWRGNRLTSVSGSREINEFSVSSTSSSDENS